MSHLIDSALVNAFVAGAFGLSIAHENRAFEPTPGTAYAELFVLPNTPGVASLGSHGLDIHDGIMQVSLWYPAGEGAGAAKQKATAVRDYFYAGRSFTYSTQTVEIVSCGRGPGRNIDSWYRVPVTVTWRAWTQR